MIVHPNANPQQKKVLKHLQFVGYGCGMQFERFFSLNHGDDDDESGSGQG